MAASPEATIKQHVPAWKRLGLKLKYANDVPNESWSTQQQPPAPEVADEGLNAGPGSKKRCRSEGDGADSRSKPKKKRKSSTPTSHETSQTSPADSSNRSTSIGKERSTNNEHGAVETAHNQPVAQVRGGDNKRGSEVRAVEGDGHESLKRRKSVTFTPDTKGDDGSSAQDLFKEWSANEQASIANQESTKEAQNDSPSVKVSKKAKKASKLSHSEPAESLETATRSSHASAKDTAAIPDVPEYVRYLVQYHSDKAHWKFNKNKQKDLLKNLFDCQRIPVEHEPALIAYIGGLQGAAAQRRVLEDAEEVLKKLPEAQDRSSEIEGMGSRAERKAAYEAALQRQIEKLDRIGAGSSEYEEQQLLEIRQEVQKAKRADALLFELLSKELAPPPPPPTSVQPQPQLVNGNSDHQSNSTGAPNSVASAKDGPMLITKRKKKRKARTDVSSDDSSSESEGEYNKSRGPATLHEAIVTRHDPPKPFKSGAMVDPMTTGAARRIYGFDSAAKPTGKKKIFDDDLLDNLFPKKQTYHETAPKRKAGGKSDARGFAYMHGTRVDESGSEDD